MTRPDAWHHHGPSAVRRPCRLATIAILGVGCLLGVAAGAADLVVQDGDVQSNDTPATYDTVTVFGTNALTGDPSTYTADAPLTLSGNGGSVLSVYDSGVFNANANVTAADGSVQVSDGGRLNLGSGTLSAVSISLSGPNAVSRAGGAYLTLSFLGVTDGATLGYTAADTIGPSATVTVSTGGRLTLGATLSLTDYASQMNISGSGALDTQGNDYKTSYLTLSNTAALAFAGDSEIRDQLTVGYGSQLQLQTNLVMQPFSTMQLSGSNALVTNGHSFSTANLQLSGGADVTLGGGGSVTDSVDVGAASTFRLEQNLSLTGGLTLQPGRPGSFLFPPTPPSTFVTNGYDYSIGSLSLGNGQSLTFGGSSAIATTLSVSGSSTFVLDKDLSLTGAMTLSGTNPLVKNGHHVSASSLSLSGSAIMTYAAGDSITSSVTVGGNALPGPFAPRTSGGSLTLEQDLTLTGALQLTGSGALVTNGHNYSAASLTLGGTISLAYNSGDSITTSISVAKGSSLVLGKDLSLANGLSLSGSGALVRNGHSVVAGSLALRDVAFAYGGGDSVTTDVNLGSNTSLTLNKNLTVDSMEIQGNGVLNANGHHYSVNQMWLQGGGGVGPQVAYTAGDSIGTLALYGLGGATGLTASGSLSLQGLTIDNGGTLTAYAPVTLQSSPSYSLTIYNGGKVQLENFTNVWSGGSWGLKWAGNHTADLQSYVIQEKIAYAGDYNNLHVAYDVNSDATYVSLANSFARVPLADGGSLAGLSLSSGTGGGASTASFAAGTASGTGGTVTWAFGSGGVLSVHGLDGVAQVLQMSYDPTGLSLADQQGLALAWLDPTTGQWVNAVLGNHGTNPVTMSSPWQGSWASYVATRPGAALTDLLGAYGVDTTTHMVWAAINHNSDFSVPVPVPEPTTAALAVAGLAAVALARRTVQRSARRRF